MVKPKFDSTGSLLHDKGEQLLLDEEWVKVDPPKKETDKNRYLKTKDYVYN